MSRYRNLSLDDVAEYVLYKFGVSACAIDIAHFYTNSLGYIVVEMGEYERAGDPSDEALRKVLYSGHILGKNPATSVLYDSYVGYPDLELEFRNEIDYYYNTIGSLSAVMQRYRQHDFIYDISNERLEYVYENYSELINRRTLKEIREILNIV